MQTKTEDVYVTKLVGLVTRIPKHLDLYFSDFFYELLGTFKVQPRNKRKGTENLQIGPYKFLNPSRYALGRSQSRGGVLTG